MRQKCATSASSTFHAQVDKVSQTTLLLVDILKSLTGSDLVALKGLQEEIGSFTDAIIMLSYHLRNARQMGNEDEWWNSSRFEVLLRSSDLCLSRLVEIIMNGLMSERRSVQRYIKNEKLGKVIRHLRLRLRIYIAAFSAPVILPTIDMIRPSFGQDFGRLGSKLIEERLQQLQLHCCFLEDDPNIEDMDSRKTHALRNQRLDLINVTQSLLQMFVEQRQGSPSSVTPSPQERRHQSTRSEYTSQRSTTTSSSIITRNSSVIASQTTAPSTPGPYPEVLVPRILISRTSTNGTDLYSSHNDYSNNTLADPQHRHDPYHTTIPSEPVRFQQPLRTNSEPTSAAQPFTTLPLNWNGIDPDKLPPEAHAIISSYSTAQTHLSQGFGNLALPYLQASLSFILKASSRSPPPIWLTTLPTRNTILFDLSSAYSQARPPQTERAISLLSDLYHEDETSGRERYTAAHILAQVLTGNGDGLGESSKKDLMRARGYVAEAAVGRVQVLGPEHKEAVESLNLLERIDRKIAGGEPGGSQRRQGQSASGRDEGD